MAVFNYHIFKTILLPLHRVLKILKHVADQIKKRVFFMFGSQFFENTA